MADRGAQRIRSISPQGYVTTIAGSGALVALGIGVPGGYVDGATTSARFDDPEDVAVMPDGTILVADTLNNCIRSIVKGFVRTFAGRCRDEGNANGGLLAARFGRPRSLAVASNGDVYVADPPNGIRRISGGMVSNFQCPHDSDAFAIAVTSKPKPTMLLSSGNQVTIVDLRTGQSNAELALTTSFVSGAQRASIAPTGPPTGIAAFAADDFVFADPFDGVVELGQIGYRGLGSYLRVLGALPPFTSTILDGKFADGAAGSARFDQPMAVAIAPDGRVAVADMGNRRVRILAPFDHATYVTDADNDTELPVAPDPSVHRIALVGNSLIDYMQGWEDSIAGEFEAIVNKHLVPGEKRIEVYPVMRPGTSTSALLSLIDNDFGDGGFDAVVLDVPDPGQLPSVGTHSSLEDPPNDMFPKDWPTTINRQLRATHSKLAAVKTSFSALIHPGVTDFLDEDGYLWVEKGAPPGMNQLSASSKDATTIQGYHDEIEAALLGADVPVIDAWPAMLADHANRQRESLFLSWDHHLTPHGRAVLAEVLAANFLKAHQAASTH